MELFLIIRLLNWLGLVRYYLCPLCLEMH